MIKAACSRALFPKRNSSVKSINLEPQRDDQMCNLDLLVFSYAVNSEHRSSHSQDNGMQALVIHSGSGIRSLWCNQEHRLPCKHNRSDVRRPGKNLQMVGRISVFFAVCSCRKISLSPRCPGFHHCLAKLRRMPGKRKISGPDAAGFQSVSLE